MYVHIWLTNVCVRFAILIVTLRGMLLQVKLTLTRDNFITTRVSKPYTATNSIQAVANKKNETKQRFVLEREIMLMFVWISTVLFIFSIYTEPKDWCKIWICIQSTQKTHDRLTNAYSIQIQIQNIWTENTICGTRSVDDKLQNRSKCRSSLCIPIYRITPKSFT